ncbi:hypothetical protein FRC17_009695 [Serendipita sp. 399]|nr:hypothetical protein FRC17_009695 [Serendipita sp. 399]
MFIPAQMRRESIDSQVSSHPTEHFPSPKPSASSLRSLTNSSTTGRLSISSSRRQSNLAISFTNPYLEGSSNPSPSGEARPIVASPARSENLMSTSGTTQNASITSPNLQSPAMVPPVGPIFALSNAHIRRNFSSTSASTSGSSSSVPSNPGLKHANELAAAYASMGININSPMLGEPADSVIDQQQNNGSSDPLTMNDDDIEWHRAHPIVVRDYAYDEEDERFSMIPVDLMLRCDRPQPMQHTRRASQSRFMTGGGSSYNSGAHYGGRWDPDDEEEDDDWGFPMGSITTASGTEAPLGATRSGPSSQLKNRTRAWNNLGSRSFGGQRINFSEEESSGFYEESGEEEGFDDFGTIHRRQDGDEEDEGDYGEDVQTPSRTYLHSPLRDAVVHPEMDDHHGIDGDDDHSPYSTGDDEEDYENRAPLRSGVYRVVYPFTAEGPSEMSVEKDQLVRVLGRHGHGWALVLRDWTVERAIKGRRESLEGGSRSNEDEPQALVPESYLAVYQLDAEDATFLDR